MIERRALSNPKLSETSAGDSCQSTGSSGAEENVERLKAEFEPQGIKLFPYRQLRTGGFADVIDEISLILKDYPEDIVFEEEYEEFEAMEGSNEPSR